jgi:hypothetical protein
VGVSNRAVEWVHGPGEAAGQKDDAIYGRGCEDAGDGTAAGQHECELILSDFGAEACDG